MIRHVLAFSIARRWLVVLASIGLALWGAWSLARLPIDAVPDITNNQVQINVTATALSPAEVEKQVTFPIETALAGIPGLESTRSLSRNGFAQVTAIFTEKTSIYFARQQINERLIEIRQTLPPGARPKIGPVSTGLGEITMWSVSYANGAAVKDGEPGPQRDGSFLTPEGQRLRTEVERAAYLRTVQDWVIRPQLKNVPGVAGIDAIGGYLKQYQVQPDPAKLIGLGLTFSDIVKAIEANNVSRGANVIERNGEGIVVRSGGRIESLDELRAIAINTRSGVPIRIGDIAAVSIGGEIRTGSASENGREVVIGTALMLIGANSRTVAAAVDARMQQIEKSLPPGIQVRIVLNRMQLVDCLLYTSDAADE